MKSLKSMSNKWFDAIYWSFLLLGILMIKNWVVFSLTALGTLKWGCVIKKSQILIFLPLKTNSVTIGLNFLLYYISAIISSNTINILLFFLGLYFLNFHKRHNFFFNIQWMLLEFLNIQFLCFSFINKQLILWLKWIFGL